MFQAKHENEVEAHRSEKLPIKQKCQSYYCTGYKNSIETKSGSKENPNSFGS